MRHTVRHLRIWLSTFSEFLIHEVYRFFYSLTWPYHNRTTDMWRQDCLLSSCAPLASLLLIERPRQFIQNPVALLAKCRLRVPDLFAVKNGGHAARKCLECRACLVHQGSQPIDSLGLVDKLASTFLFIQLFKVGDGDFFSAFGLIHALGVVVGADKLGDDHVFDVELVSLGAVEFAVPDFG